ncbi:MAG: VOC family protein [Zavarzinia sp.]|nr:VOC family protein [Zavarzinia sp.]
MIIGLDHIVVVVPGLEAAVARYRALGFEVTPGGRHSTGTENALIGFGDAGYIELLAFATPNPAHRWAPILGFGGGFVDVCLSSDDIAADRAIYEAAGIAMQPEMAMSRTKPDGTEIAWKLSIPKPPFAGAMPFLIEDLTPVAARRPAPRAHANGVTGIARVTYAEADVAEAAIRWRTILGTAGTPVADPAVGGEGLRFALPGLQLDLLGPSVAGGPIAQSLADHGASPFSVGLAGAAATLPRWPVAETINVRFDA